MLVCEHTVAGDHDRRRERRDLRVGVTQLDAKTPNNRGRYSLALEVAVPIMSLSTISIVEELWFELRIAQAKLTLGQQHIHVTNMN